MLTKESQLIAQAISSKIEDISSGLQEVYNPSNPKYTISRAIEIANNEPTVYACLQLKASRLVELIGIYKNPDKEKQNFIQRNIANMKGSLTEVYLECGTAIPFGFSAHEILFRVDKTFKRKEWNLHGFNFLNPDENSISFELIDNKPENLLLQESEKKLRIPMWKILHLRNGLLTSFGRRKLFGYPEIFRIAPYVKLKDFIYQQLAIAARTRATGILVGKSHTNVRVNETILGPDGRPVRSGRVISSSENLFNNLINVKNFSCMVIPKGDEVFPLNLPSGERFFSLALQLCNEQIYRGLLVPSLLLERSVASYTLSDTQLTVFDANIKTIANQIQDQFIEKIIKPLIVWNFGRQTQYGEFKDKQETSLAFLQARIASMYEAIDRGVIDNQDPEVVASVRDLVGFKPLTAEEIEFKNLMREQMQKLQIEEQAEIDPAAAGETPEDLPEEPIEEAQQ